MDEIKKLLDTYFDLDIKWVFGALVISLISFIFISKTMTRKRAIVAALLCFYMLVVLSYTVLSRPTTGQMHYRFEPLWSYKLFGSSLFYREQILLNIALYVPIGFMLPIVNGKYRLSVLIGLSFSSVIELLQLVTTVGLFEFDDIISNTVGAVIGCGCLWVVRRIMRRRKPV